MILGRHVIMGGDGVQMFAARGGQSPFSPLDIDDLALWLAADAITGVSDGGVIASWPDLSGSDSHAVQATAKYKPTLQTNELNGLPIVEFDGVDDKLTAPYPLGVATDLTVFLRVKQVALTGWGHWNFANGTGVFGKAWTLSASGTAIYACTEDYIKGIVAADVLTLGKWNTFRFRKNGGAAANLSLWNRSKLVGVNGGQTAGSPIANAVDIGRTAGACQIAEMIVYARSLSDAECTQVEGYLGRWIKDAIFCDGDSLTAGSGATAGNDYPNQLWALYSSPADMFIYNFGVGGQTTTQMIADAVDQIDPLLNANSDRNILVAWSGTNDITGGGKTGAEAYALTAAYCAARQAAGFTVLVLTMLPRGDETWEVQRTAYNTALRAGYAAFADALVDIAADNRIGDYGDNSDATYYADGTHLTNAGYAIVAAAVKTAIDTL